MTTNAEASGCVHHFVIPEPSGVNEVMGVCKKCGDEREHELVIPFNVFNPWRGDPKKAAKAKLDRAMTAGAAETKRKDKDRKRKNDTDK